jgi:hypothetical protein
MRSASPVGVCDALAWILGSRSAEPVLGLAEGKTRGLRLPVDDEGGKVGENVDRIAQACLLKPLISAFLRFFLLLFLHALFF